MFQPLYSMDSISIHVKPYRGCPRTNYLGWSQAYCGQYHTIVGLIWIHAIYQMEHAYFRVYILTNISKYFQLIDIWMKAYFSSTIPWSQHHYISKCDLGVYNSNNLGLKIIDVTTRLLIKSNQLVNHEYVNGISQDNKIFTSDQFIFY